MPVHTHVTFRDIPHSDAVEAYVRKKAQKLEHRLERVRSCRVAVESPHRHHVHGRHYRVRIQLGVPGHELVVGRPHLDRSHEDLYAAIDCAFDDALRVLSEHARRRRADRRSAPPPMPPPGE